MLIELVRGGGDRLVALSRWRSRVGEERGRKDRPLAREIIQHVCGLKPDKARSVSRGDGSPLEDLRLNSLLSLDAWPPAS